MWSGDDVPEHLKLAGSLQRKALQCIYTLAFLCLLRGDEVLKLCFEHLVCGEDENMAYIKVTLPFRKTHQFGGLCLFCSGWLGV